jgi:hypothetical protein
VLQNVGEPFSVHVILLDYLKNRAALLQFFITKKLKYV